MSSHLVGWLIKLLDLYVTFMFIVFIVVVLLMPLTIFYSFFNIHSRFCYQAAACNAGNRISTVAATDLFVDTFQHEPGVDISTVGNLRRTISTANAASSAFAPSKQWGVFNDKISNSLNWQSPAFHRTGECLSLLTLYASTLLLITSQDIAPRHNTAQTCHLIFHLVSHDIK